MARKPNPPTLSTDIRLKLLGIGGAGGNAVAQIAGTLAGVESIAINPDLQALASVSGMEKLPIGSAVTHGLGAGGEPETGARAALQDAERLEAVLRNTDLVFLVAGLGGGTGTGASPVIARIAKEQGAMVLAFVALPFSFEGERRRQQAQAGLEQLRAQADAVICIPNDKLLKLAGDGATAIEVFQTGNDLIATGVRAIWQLLSRRGLINLDFADVRTALGGRHGDGLFSFGEGKTSEEAVAALLKNPLLDGGEILAKTDAVLVSVLGGPDMTVADVQRAVEPISRLSSRAHLIMGAAVDEAYRGRFNLTVIASANLAPRRVAQTPAARSPVARTTALRPAAPAPAAPAKKEMAQAKQENLPLDNVSRGRFDKSEPTLHNGEDLDVPTFIRRGVSLKR